MTSRGFLSLACVLPGALAAVLDLPIWVRTSYSLIETQVGTPPVQHLLLFDTGSSTTWMVDSSCVTDDAVCPNYSHFTRNGYSVSTSTTAEPLGTYDDIAYLGGGVAGSGINDTFSLPGTNTSWTQSFMAANKSSWYNIPSDGFLGLAFTTIADAGTTTLVETLLQGGELDEPRMGLYYGTEFNYTGDGPGDGILTLGGSHEETYAEGELTWATLQVPGKDAQLWRTDVRSVTSAGVATTNKTISVLGSWAVFDTGAGRISIPPAYIKDVYASIGMNWTAILAGQHIPLCTEFTADWSVSFVFGTAAAPATITLRGDQLAVPGFGPGGDEYCWPPFDAGDAGSGLFLFGSQFLRMFYTVFDFGGFVPADYNARIGFGELKEEFKV